MTATKGLKINRRNGAAYSKKDKLFYAALLALPMLQLVVFYFIVNFKSFLMGFQVYDTVNGVYSFTSDGEAAIKVNWSWFTDLVSGKDFWNYIENSFMVWCFSTLAGTVLAVFFSYYIYKKRIGFNFFKFMLFMPSLLPGIFLATIYKKFVGEGLPTIFEYIFNIPGMKNVFSDGTFFGTYADNTPALVVTLFTVWVSFGSQVLVYTGAMDQISPEVIEAAKLDGASPIQEFVHVILPQILPSMSTFIIAGVAGIFTNRNNILSFFGFQTTFNVRTMGYYLYWLVANGRDNWCRASLLGLLLSIIGLLMNYGIRKLLKRYSV